mmetsp:Transcript_38053/g.101972  ORF Transcript_38053/g.101972 Transcript_38053/m.101972 type:complete len:269 (-) Transcript_38053:1469-2275(-)
MISFMSACMAVSSSIFFWITASLSPGRPPTVTSRSVRFVRLFFFTTSTHSYLFSGSFFLFFLGLSGSTACPFLDFSSASPFCSPLAPGDGSPASSPPLAASGIGSSPSSSFFSSSPFAAASGAASSPPAPCGAAGSAAPSGLASSASAAGAASASLAGSFGSFGSSLSPLAPSSSSASAPSGSSASPSGSGGSSRFSLTISSYSSSSRSWAPSMLKVPCKVSLALTFTFLGSSWVGSSTRQLPSSLGVLGSSALPSLKNALTSNASLL